jgi:hypothetical protein
MRQVPIAVRLGRDHTAHHHENALLVILLDEAPKRFGPGRAFATRVQIEPQRVSHRRRDLLDRRIQRYGSHERARIIAKRAA